jgi:hypothetical protein
MVGKKEPMPNIAADTSSAHREDMNSPNITPATPELIVKFNI